MNIDTLIQSGLENLSVSEIYTQRNKIARTIARSLGRTDDDDLIERMTKKIASQYRCYAAAVTHMRGGHAGYPASFDAVTLFPGRMTAMAASEDLTGKPRPDSPWLDLLPALIFISDLGDALSREVHFAFLKQEIIDNVASPKGSRHLWIWLTKRPERMLEFDRWLAQQGIAWPDNLIAATTLTSKKFLSRVYWLKEIRAKFKSLSVEPLWERIKIPLDGINWLKLGGESGAYAKPFDLAWAYDLRDQCAEAGTAFFLKQLGAEPTENGQPIKLKHPHGGDWNEWPRALRIRQFPAEFYRPQGKSVNQ